MKDDVYLKGVEQHIERLLTNMDRNTGSKTFGCLCRPFWHDKTMDFPSAHQQIGVFPLSIAYTQEWAENPYYQEEEIKRYVEGSLNFWADMQKRDGSFDEHYPNEHSLGATAWTLWAVTESYLLLDDPPDIETEIEQAVDFLKKEDEPGDIANHQAVAASALLNSHHIIGKGRKDAEKRLNVLEDMQHREGWFQEYEGADIGYQSTTISHLGRIWKRDPEMVDDNMIERSLEFFSDFIEEEGYYAGIIGSRNTWHLHPAGFEILADDFKKAAEISQAIRTNRVSGNLLSPAVMDDKHFSRQLAEYMDASRYASDREKSSSEVEEKDYKCISIRKPDSKSKVFINVSKGGVISRFQDGDLVESDTGVAVEKNGEVYTANWPGVTSNLTRDNGELVLEGELQEVPRNTLPGIRFLAWRIFNHTLGRSQRISLTLKDYIISLLIRGKSQEVSFRREIDLENEVDIEDEFEGDYLTGKVRANFVPSSEYFSLSTEPGIGYDRE